MSAHLVGEPRSVLFVGYASWQIGDMMKHSNKAIGTLTSDLFVTDGGVFMGARRDPADCSVALFGVAYDGTTSFRPGTRFGPAAIRAVSEGLETYDPQLDCDLADVAYADLGAVDCPTAPPNPWSRPCAGPPTRCSTRTCAH